MPRPAFVFCDSDAVIQFLLAREVRPLRLLRAKYAIQPLLVREVELELQSHRRFGPRISHGLKKALEAGVLQVLEKKILDSHFGAPPAGPLAAADAMSKIEKLGRQFLSRVDTGEAYTHAAAVTLGVPSLSHDRSALDALIAAGLQVPGTVLRAFDLVALAYQVKELTEHECDGFRAALEAEKEYVPNCFARAGFGAGLAQFCPRMTDMRFPAVGTGERDPVPFSNVVDL